MGDSLLEPPAADFDPDLRTPFAGEDFDAGDPGFDAAFGDPGFDPAFGDPGFDAAFGEDPAFGDPAFGDPGFDGACEPLLGLFFADPAFFGVSSSTLSSMLASAASAATGFGNENDSSPTSRAVPPRSRAFSAGGARVRCPMWRLGLAARVFTFIFSTACGSLDQGSLSTMGAPSRTGGDRTWIFRPDSTEMGSCGNVGHGKGCQVLLKGKEDESECLVERRELSTTCSLSC